MRSKLGVMLTLQRRHSTKCPHRQKGPDSPKCRCPVRVGGIVEGKRVRVSLKTRDLRRAARRLAEMEQQGFARPRKRLVGGGRGLPRAARRPCRRDQTQVQAAAQLPG